MGCLNIGEDKKFKFVKFGLSHKVKDCGLKCGYCEGMVHLWEVLIQVTKNIWTTIILDIKFFEIFMNDDKTTLN